MLAARYRLAAAIIGGAAAALGVGSLAGWAAGLAHGVLGAGALMKPNAAVCFVALGTALVLAHGGRVARLLSWALAATAAALALATLAEWTFRVDLGIDELLFRDETGAYTRVPGRIAPNTALAFFLLAASLLSRGPGGRQAGLRRALAAAGLALGAIALAGYLYGASRLYALAQHTGMAGPTALGLAVLGCGVLLHSPEKGTGALLTSEAPGGTLFRWLLPVVALAPLLLAVPAQSGVAAGILDQAYASALVTVGLTAVLAWVVVTAARAVNAKDAARRERERENERLTEELARRARDLLTVNRELEAFSYSVSHDLRSPLRSIDGFGQALVEDCAAELPQVGHEHVRRIRAATQRMAQLIDDLLQLSRVTRTEMHRERVDLSRIATEITAELARAEPGRRVAVEIAAGLAAEGDPRLLRLALENLLRNAWKFTSGHPAARIVFGRCEREGEEAFFLQDDGAGFDMAHAAKLFGAFQRLHGTNEFPGTGIGLATVQRIVHRHGGRIWAEGEVERGAKFTFTLPGGRRGTEDRERAA